MVWARGWGGGGWTDGAGEGRGGGLQGGRRLSGDPNLHEHSQARVRGRCPRTRREPAVVIFPPPFTLRRAPRRRRVIVVLLHRTAIVATAAARRRVGVGGRHAPSLCLVVGIRFRFRFRFKRQFNFGVRSFAAISVGVVGHAKEIIRRGGVYVRIAIRRATENNWCWSRTDRRRQLCHAIRFLITYCWVCCSSNNRNNRNNAIVLDVASRRRICLAFPNPAARGLLSLISLLRAFLLNAIKRSNQAVGT